jgi:hypothetical protein
LYGFFFFPLPSFFLETLQKLQQHEIAPELHEIKLPTQDQNKWRYRVKSTSSKDVNMENLLYVVKLVNLMVVLDPWFFFFFSVSRF